MVINKLWTKFKEVSDAKERERIRIVRTLIENESLTCKKCGFLSVPVLGAERKYRCIYCGRQFANVPHNFTSGHCYKPKDPEERKFISPDIYKQAIEQIKKDIKSD